MLQSMPSLLVINLRKTWMKYLLDAMTADPALHSQQGPSNSTKKPKPYCPGLEALHFHLTDFNEHDVAEPQSLKPILQLFEKRAEEHGLKKLIISAATDFDHPAGWAVTQCFQRIGMPGTEYIWDGSVHMRKPTPIVEEVTDEETEGEESDSEEEEEEEYECTMSDLECF